MLVIRCLGFFYLGKQIFILITVTAAFLKIKHACIRSIKPIPVLYKKYVDIAATTFAIIFFILMEILCYTYLHKKYFNV